MFLFFNFNSIMTAQGNTLTPTILSGISALLNVVLDPIFIFTLDMGIAGGCCCYLIIKDCASCGRNIGVIPLRNFDKAKF